MKNKLEERIIYWMGKNYIIVPDKLYLKLKYKNVFNKKLDLI